MLGGAVLLLVGTALRYRHPLYNLTGIYFGLTVAVGCAVTYLAPDRQATGERLFWGDERLLQLLSQQQQLHGPVPLPLTLPPATSLQPVALHALLVVVRCLGRRLPDHRRPHCAAAAGR